MKNADFLSRGAYNRTFADIYRRSHGQLYLYQYGAFASAQTGNIILSIIQAFDGEWLSVGKKYCLPFSFLRDSSNKVSN